MQRTARGTAHERLLGYYRKLQRWTLGPLRRELGVMHRAVKRAASDSQRTALGFVSGEVERALAARLAPGFRVLDLGCGLGGTLARLVHGAAERGIGLTLSEAQARAVAARATRAGLPGRLLVVVGDFHRVPLARARFDAVVMIEALVHARAPDAVLAEAARLLVSEGLLVVVDDFPAPEARSDPACRRLLARFQRGWRLGPLPGCGELESMARRCGLVLVERCDFTPLIRRHPPQGSWWVRPFAWLDLPGDLGGALSGAGARELLTARGALRYLLLVFARR